MKPSLFILLVAMMPVAASADIFQCVNQYGETVFKDKPCAGAETLVQQKNIESLKKNNIAHLPVLESDSQLGKNLLRNASFENRLVDWVVPEGAFWTGNGGVKNKGALVMHAEKLPEEKYKDGHIYETTVSQCVPLNAGEKYQLAARFRYDKLPEKKHANRANVTWYLSSDCSTGGQYGWFIEPAPEFGWQSLLRKNLKPALGAQSAMITIVQRARYANNGKAFWDDIHFSAHEIHEQSDSLGHSQDNDQRQYPVGHNYVSNGTFDNDLEGWRKGWVVQYDAVQGDVAPGSARITAASTTGGVGALGMAYCVNTDADTGYKLGASFKRDTYSTQQGDARLRVTWYEKEACSGRAGAGRKSVKPTKAKGWQKLKVSGLHSPKDSKSTLVELIQTVDGNGEFSAYWDDVYLISTP